MKSEFSTFQDRIGELETGFADPFAPDNPLGFRRILEADEQAEPFKDGEAFLDDYGLNAEFVPAELGGRLTRLDELVEVMRAVYRRDPCMGLGYGASSFISAVNVWTAGNTEQQRTTADWLLANRKVAACYHELAHGNDMARTDFQAVPGPSGLVLNGRKEVVTNIRRSDALVLFARTDSKAGTRSHSQLLVDKADLAADRITHLPRFRTAGMRGVQLGGIEFRDCPLPAGAVMGEPGQGMETAIRSFQITRTTLVSMFTGVLDTGLRITLRHARTRPLYGRTAADLPHVRSVVTGAFADLLLCDGFATVATRALHLLPAETSVYAQAVKFSVSKVLMDAMSRLSGVLGAHFYIRQGEAAIFQKMLRDIQPAGFGHAARAVCQVGLLPYLPLLARRSWRGGTTPAPAELFQLDRDLPPLLFDRLTVSASGRERLSSELAAGLDDLPEGGDHITRELRSSAQHFAAELRELADVCEKLPPGELSVTADSAAYDLVTRYTRVLAAAACFGIWRHNRRHSDPFLRDPVWAAAALHRLRAPIGAPMPSLPEHLERPLYEELTRRLDSSRGFGLGSLALSPS
ncbi:acyl-CoA dehydrogenase [Streptomyces europaeiscabiei]|uniref:acyl-CoA dehydrogenase n=1 Tax=Streptomyces europaeiscabiei TaxID=146819 RepID=UPI002E16F86E